MSNKSMRTTDNAFHTIVKTMHLAKKNVKNPKVRLETCYAKQPVVLTIASANAMQPGSINVSDGKPWGESTWFGRIQTNGVFEFSRKIEHSMDESLRQELLNTLQEFEDNPETTAAVHGQKTGHCCFCGIGLTNKDSLAVGYGPVCAENYNLPWHGMAKQIDEEQTGKEIEKVFTMNPEQEHSVMEQNLLSIQKQIDLWEGGQQTAEQALDKIAEYFI